MILEFKHRRLKRFFEKGDLRHIGPEHQRKVADMLCVLDSAEQIEDFDIATFRLHPLKWNRLEVI